MPADGHGIWAAAGINSENVAKPSTATILTNSRVLGVAPLVAVRIGVLHMPTIVLPYIHSARVRVQRLGSLLQQYGT